MYRLGVKHALAFSWGVDDECCDADGAARTSNPPIGI
jgi:hypothetical protein